MESLITQLRLFLWPIVALISTFLIVAAFVTRKYLKAPSKDLDNRLLLKQLLEGFGLELPPELEEISSPVVKSVKAP